MVIAEHPPPRQEDLLLKLPGGSYVACQREGAGEVVHR